MSRRIRSAITLLTLIVLTSPRVEAQGYWPGLSARFTQPVATGSPTDSWDIWVELALASTADPFAFDGFSPATYFGLGLPYMPTTGYLADNSESTFASYSYATLTQAFGCGGTFTTVCNNGPPYDFDFAPNPFSNPFALDPGDTFSFNLGTFTPTGGAAPPGTYRYYDAIFEFFVSGLDVDGNDIHTWVALTKTCPGGQSDDCAFIRTVNAAAATSTVPEPATLALLAAGLIGMGAVGRRRVMRT